MALLVGRKQEQNELRRLYQSGEAEMVVVYGRRRVGKTFLINQVFDDKGFTFKLTGLHKQKRDVQLRNFVSALKEYSGRQDWSLPKTWEEAFGQLKQYLKETCNGQRRVLFFDELPWMDTPGGKFLPSFEAFWNGWANAQNDLMLIVCGSATNWIINKFFNNKGGLYNRSSSKLYLEPFTLAETEEYLTKQGFAFERYDIAQLYMIMGGIPYYLKQLEPGRTLSDNIDNCFFKSHGKLWDEFDNLYATLFENAQLYMHIVEVLASKRMGLTREEIITKTKLPDNGVTSKALSNLCKCGFVREHAYFGRKKKGLLYQLSDYYTLFYFHFIKDGYGRDEHFWTHLLDNPRKNAWAGFTFEQVVNDHIEPLKKALGIASVLTEESSWYSAGNENTDGVQIDLLIDRRDRTINLCEIKFYGSEFVIDKNYAMKLRKKMTALREATATKKSIALTMVTTFGVATNSYSPMVQQQATLDDLFNR